MTQILEWSSFTDKKNDVSVEASIAKTQSMAYSYLEKLLNNQHTQWHSKMHLFCKLPLSGKFNLSDFWRSSSVFSIQHQNVCAHANWKKSVQVHFSVKQFYIQAHRFMEFSVDASVEFRHEGVLLICAMTDVNIRNGSKNLNVSTHMKQKIERN